MSHINLAVQQQGFPQKQSNQSLDKSLFVDKVAKRISSGVLEEDGARRIGINSKSQALPASKQLDFTFDNPFSKDLYRNEVIGCGIRMHSRICRWLLYAMMTFSIDGIAQEKAVQQTIVDRLQRWPLEFNAKNIPAVCDLFAPDLIAVYPDAPDRNYKGMCNSLTTAIKSEDRNYQYELSKIEQIIVACDLAVVRLIWTLTVTDVNQTATEQIKERGMDVFKKQKDGQWRISISYAYPMQEN